MTTSFVNLFVTTDVTGYIRLCSISSCLRLDHDVDLG